MTEPVPPQTIERDALISYFRSGVLLYWVGGKFDSEDLADGVLSLSAPDPRFDTIRALHRRVTRGGPNDLVCSQCWDYENSTSDEWPCATVRALDGNPS